MQDASDSQPVDGPPAHRSSLGVDVGSTTVKVVVLRADGELAWHRCERHHGKPREVVGRLLAQARSAGAADRGARAGLAPLAIGAAGSIGTRLAAELCAVPVHEVRALVLATRARFPGSRSLVELGGQDAKLVRLGDRPGSDDMQMNDRCAAGTGATLDRVAARLGLSADQLSSARLVGDLSVAAKCGVFAETDVVDLVKRGADWESALSALGRAIVVQNLAVLARGRLLRPPVLLLGGPHAHLPMLAQAWREALDALWRARGVEVGPVEVPVQAELFAAIGAAIHAARGGRALACVAGGLGSPRVGPPLLGGQRDRRALDALRCARAPAALGPGRARVHLGLDAGSTTSKAVLLDTGGRLVACSYGPSAGNPVDDARARIGELAAEAARRGADLEVVSMGVTGYGAELVGPAFGADEAPVETVAHAVAAAHAFPGTEVVVDVGGTDVKIMQLEGGRVRAFHVSNHCSAGHGAFLAAMAAELGVPLDRYAERALAATRSARFTVGCGVFMDTDRVTFQRDGFDPDELLAGLAWALAHNIWEFVVPEAPERLGRRFLLTGGTQRNLAAAWAQVAYLRGRVPGAHVAVHPQPELCGAMGAALESMRARAASSGPSRFVGWKRAACVRVEVRRDARTRCSRCELGCERSVIELQGSAARVTVPDAAPHRLVVGNACERGADTGASGQRSRTHAPDLLAEEAQRLFRPLLPAPRAGRPAPRPTIGIPRVMALYRSAPLLLHYLRGAGVPSDHLVLSPPTSPSFYQAGARWGVNDPCFPSKLVLSHVDWLLRSDRHRPLDVLLMPAISHAAIAVRGTADTASCPIVAACGQASVAALGRDADVLAALGIRAMTPALCLVDHARLERQLLGAFGELLGLDARRNRAALDHGLAAQRRFHERCRTRGRWVIDRALARGRAAAVVLARPYHADPGVQHGISTQLAARGVPVLSVSSLPIDDDASLDLSDVLPLVTNSGCAEKMWAARVVAANPNLLAVDLSSFRCGQDASILAPLSELLADAGKPALRLHDLDEDRPGATLRLRIETFVHALRRYEAESLVRTPSRARVAESLRACGDGRGPA